MWIDERIVLSRPKSVEEMNKRKQSGWARRRILASLWDLRVKYIISHGVDILNVIPTSDGVEFTLKGEIDANPVPEEQKWRVKSNYNQRKKKDI